MRPKNFANSHQQRSDHISTLPAMVLCGRTAETNGPVDPTLSALLDCLTGLDLQRWAIRNASAQN